MGIKKYDCCNCSHYRVCYKIHTYHIRQENTGLYCPCFEEKQSKVAREFFAEIREKGKFNDPCVEHICLSFDELAEIEKKYK